MKPGAKQRVGPIKAKGNKKGRSAERGKLWWQPQTNNTCVVKISRPVTVTHRGRQPSVRLVQVMRASPIWPRQTVSTPRHRLFPFPSFPFLLFHLILATFAESIALMERSLESHREMPFFKVRHYFLEGTWRLWYFISATIDCVLQGCQTAQLGQEVGQ